MPWKRWVTISVILSPLGHWITQRPLSFHPRNLSIQIFSHWNLAAQIISDPNIAAQIFSDLNILHYKYFPTVILFRPNIFWPLYFAGPAGALRYHPLEGCQGQACPQGGGGWIEWRDGWKFPLDFPLQWKVMGWKRRCAMLHNLFFVIIPLCNTLVIKRDTEDHFWVGMVEMWILCIIIWNFHY